MKSGKKKLRHCNFIYIYTYIGLLSYKKVRVCFDHGDFLLRQQATEEDARAIGKYGVILKWLLQRSAHQAVCSLGFLVWKGNSWLLNKGARTTGVPSDGHIKPCFFSVWSLHCLKRLPMI